LPGQHITYVKKIDPGLPLFLFNYSDRKLHGIFEAVCSGKMNIDPYGWTNDGSERTQYPAQVTLSLRLVL
ncbi:B2 protein, partial [Linum perenne]